MVERKKQIQIIKNDFEKVQSFLSVVGDESRQLILTVLMEAELNKGMRVGEITAQTHLSRPAVSHQLRILKDLGIVKYRKEGTKNFYYIDISNNRELFTNMKKLFIDIEELMDSMER